ncbi:MAG: sodium-dependent transporter [Gammaproteobacteria bacterium]|nr:sodium-dependent transporter [Gammaproteobacteria bacterium]
MQAVDPNYKHETWSSESVFLLAAIGGAVGLGNLWRFPFMAGQNGGGAFVLVYFLFVILLCVPLILAELAMGRRGGGSGVATMRVLIREAGANRGWMSIGWISVLIPLVGMGYYSVVAGWTIDYTLKAATNAFSGFGSAESSRMFSDLTASPTRVLLFHALFILAAIVVIARGVGKGIETMTRFMMPALFVLLIVLSLNSIFNADIRAGLDFLFNPDFSKVTAEVILMALGQAFFSVAVGVGMMITYGAYVPRDVYLPKAGMWIASMDTLVAVLAGIVIFPVVFSSGLDPADGPGLIFVTLPIAFGNMPLGHIVGLLFFVLLFFAAFSTVLGMLEPAVSWLEEYRGLSRTTATIVGGVSAWLIGIAAALSFNTLSDVRLIEFVPFLAEKNIFEIVDFLVSTLLIPLNAILIALFAGWVMKRSTLLEELGMRDSLLFRSAHISLRYVAPIVIAFIFYSSFS